MSDRPDDIPEELWEAKATYDIAKMPVGGRELVCRAILAERERIAAFAFAKYDWPTRWIAAALRGKNEAYSNFIKAAGDPEATS